MYFCFGKALLCLHTGFDSIVTEEAYSKKGYRFSRSQPVCHLPNSPWRDMIKLFPARENLVSDIPAGDGKMANLFYSV